MLLNARRNAVLDGSLPNHMRPYVAKLTDVALAVIESMAYAERRDLKPARKYDDLLAQAEPADQWYLNAAKLRADWRISATGRGESSGFALEALAIIDQAIALRQDINFYGMRMAAAFLADDYNAVVETARRMVWLARREFSSRSSTSGREMSAGEISKLSVRLKSMQAGLNIARKSGRVADYKFVTLDENISQLAKEVASYGKRQIH